MEDQSKALVAVKEQSPTGSFETTSISSLPVVSSDADSVAHVSDSQKLGLNSGMSSVLSGKSPSLVDHFVLNNGGRRKSPYRGVSVREYGGYQAQISVGGKLLYLGTFTTELEAARAYDQAALMFRREKANLNFPEDANNNVEAISAEVRLKLEKLRAQMNETKDIPRCAENCREFSCAVKISTKCLSKAPVLKKKAKQEWLHLAPNFHGCPMCWQWFAEGPGQSDYLTYKRHSQVFIKLEDYLRLRFADELETAPAAAMPFAAFASHKRAVADEVSNYLLGLMEPSGKRARSDAAAGPAAAAAADHLGGLPKSTFAALAAFSQPPAAPAWPAPFARPQFDPDVQIFAEQWQMLNKAAAAASAAAPAPAHRPPAASHPLFGGRSQLFGAAPALEHLEQQLQQHHHMQAQHSQQQLQQLQQLQQHHDLQLQHQQLQQQQLQQQQLQLQLQHLQQQHLPSLAAPSAFPGLRSLHPFRSSAFPPDSASAADGTLAALQSLLAESGQDISQLLSNWAALSGAAGSANAAAAPAHAPAAHGVDLTQYSHLFPRDPSNDSAAPPGRHGEGSWEL